MNQDQEKLITDTQPANDSIVLNLEEFDLSNLDSLKNTALGNILENNLLSNQSSHTKHSSHSSHGKHSQSAMW